MWSIEGKPAEPYRLMPEEQRVRQRAVLPDAPDKSLEYLLDLASRKANRAETVRWFIRLMWRSPTLAFPHSHQFLKCVRLSVQCSWKRRMVIGRQLRLAFFYDRPHFVQCMRSVIAAGKSHETLTTPSAEAVIDFNPDVVLAPQANPKDILRLRSALPYCLFVYLRHGLVDKNNAIPTASYYDKVCVSSPASVLHFAQNGGLPKSMLWPTGYPQTDHLVGIGSRSNGRTVLYAPTHNTGLSSSNWIGPSHFTELLDRNPGLQLTIKLHPNQVRSETWEKWRSFGTRDPRVTFLDDPMTETAGALAQADLLVSDCSSAALLYLALDRPIVLLTPPNVRSAFNFDPQGIEWQWRDMADEVKDVAEFAEVVTKNLNEPARRSKERLAYRLRLFGDTLDGRCGERIIKRVEACFGLPGPSWRTK